MYARTIVIWCSILVLAILNGGLRQKVLNPSLGEKIGHVVSSILLSAAIILVTGFALPWIDPGSQRNAWCVGATWLTMTIAFEFIAGHCLFHAPWSKLLSDYNLAQGRIWALVLIVTFVSPVTLFKVQHQNDLKSNHLENTTRN